MPLTNMPTIGAQLEALNTKDIYRKKGDAFRERNRPKPNETCLRGCGESSRARTLRPFIKSDIGCHLAHTPKQEEANNRNSEESDRRNEANASTSLNHRG